MPAAHVPSPTDPLFRIGRAPDPLAYPPLATVGRGRFDDDQPSLAYQVLYAGERLACFFECLAPFRPEQRGSWTSDVPAQWLRGRRLGSFRIDEAKARSRWLDLTAPATYHELNHELRPWLSACQFDDFDASAAMSDQRVLTREIGRWAYRNGYSGILYATRHAPRLTCWAVFNQTRIRVRDRGSIIANDDEDLLRVAAAWELRLPTA